MSYGKTIQSVKISSSFHILLYCLPLSTALELLLLFTMHSSSNDFVGKTSSNNINKSTKGHDNPQFGIASCMGAADEFFINISICGTLLLFRISNITDVETGG